MVYGIGTDILEIARIERMYRQYGNALAQRILSRVEQHDFAGCRHQAAFLAKRFAAKEAFAKAVGTGIRGVVSFGNITVGKDKLGKPEYFFEPPLAVWLKEKGVGKVHLSLSDEKEYVLAFAVAESDMV